MKVAELSCVLLHFYCTCAQHLVHDIDDDDVDDDKVEDDIDEVGDNEVDDDIDDDDYYDDHDVTCFLLQCLCLVCSRIPLGIRHCIAASPPRSSRTLIQLKF